MYSFLSLTLILIFLYFLLHCIVFAYVGGTYFFLVGSLNFLARLLNMVFLRGVKFMDQKTKPHVKRIYAYSVSKRKRSDTTDKDSSDDELLGNDEDSNAGLLHSVSKGNSNDGIRGTAKTIES